MGAGTDFGGRVRTLGRVKEESERGAGLSARRQMSRREEVWWLDLNDEVNTE